MSVLRPASKRVLLFALIVTVVLVAMNIPLLHYGYMQLNGQLKIILQSVQVEDIKSSLSSEKQEKISIIQETLTFCREELGMDTKENYTTYFEHGNSTLMHVVTASSPYQLKSYEWSFPFIGSFPYKGFFSKFYAEIEAQMLKERGYDTRIGRASAWSTLGITTDPIMSSMLDKEEGKLVELIIHEITHANIFYKDSSAYNENLADFIGHYGSLKFLESKYGENDTIIDKHIFQKQDSRIYSKVMNVICTQLDSFYLEISTKDFNLNEKKDKKEKFIRQLILNIDENQFNFPKRFAFLKRSSFNPNNAFFTSFLVYRSEQDLFLNQLKQSFDGNLKAFIQYHRNMSII